MTSLVDENPSISSLWNENPSFPNDAIDWQFKRPYLNFTFKNLGLGLGFQGHT